MTDFQGASSLATGVDELQTVADLIMRKAQQTGFITSRDVRNQLKQAGLSPRLCAEVVRLCNPPLSRKQSRFYLYFPASARLRHEQIVLQRINKAVRRIIRHYKKLANNGERRDEGRLDFVQPVVVETEEGKVLNLLSRDLSESGIRLVGTQRLLGMKVLVKIPDSQGGSPIEVWTRILWTCEVGDNLFENGGRFLELD
jgi:hypothetical protein